MGGAAAWAHNTAAAALVPADCELLAVGTDVLATSAMLKTGAVRGTAGKMRWCTTPPEPMLSLDPSVS